MEGHEEFENQLQEDMKARELAKIKSEELRK